MALGLKCGVEVGGVRVVHQVVGDELIVGVDVEVPAHGGAVLVANVQRDGRVDYSIVVTDPDENHRFAFGHRIARRAHVR